MSFDKIQSPESVSQEQSSSEGGLSLSPPSFSLTADAGDAPIQRQESAEGELTTDTVQTLTPEQQTAATGHNTFVLGEAAGINALQGGLGTEVSGTFDAATNQAIATYQTNNNLARTDGKLDRDTLDRLVRNLVTNGNHTAAAAIARDFFKLDEQAQETLVQYSADQTESATVANNDAGTPVLTLGASAFTDGLTSLGTALDSALGSGASIADESWDVLFAETNTQRQDALWDNPNQAAEAGLVIWVRENFPSEEDIQNYMSRDDVTDADKIATIGKLSVELGRLEFLMGVLFHGGTNQSWESDGANRGPFVNHFKSEVGNGVNGAAWCTMFSGYLKRMLGFNDDLSTGGPLIFNAGMRLDWWATSGSNLLTGQDDFSDPSDFEDYSGNSIDTADWVTLRNTLNNNSLSEAQRETETDTFLSTRMTPQPGDIMVINTGSSTNQYSGSSSHTVTVESYSGHEVSTVEGNRGHKVTGVTLDLSDGSDVGQIIMMTRIGTEFFPQNEEDTTADAAPAAEGAAVEAEDQIEAADLLKPLTLMTRQLQLMADRRSYISDNSATATVADMAGTNSGGGTN